VERGRKEREEIAKEKEVEGGRRELTCSSSKMFLGTSFNPSGPFISRAWRTCMPATKSRAEKQAATRLGGGRDGGRDGGREGESVR